MGRAAIGCPAERKLRSDVGASVSLVQTVQWHKLDTRLLEHVQRDLAPFVRVGAWICRWIGANAVCSTVLFEILSTLGLGTSEYEAKSHMIDDHLLAKRNHIAHGIALDVEVDDYLRLHAEILSLMNLLRDQIENAAVTRQFLHGPSAAETESKGEDQPGAATASV